MFDPVGLLGEIAASPRPAGSDSEQRARARCAELLRGAGYYVAEESFEYSALPGLWGTPIAGVVSALTLGFAGWMGVRGDPALALAVLAGMLVVFGLGGRWTARRGVLSLPWLRRSGTNLVARRGEPRVWLMAHLDTKSQPVPIAVRAGAIVGTALVWAAALVVAVLQLWRPEVAGAWPWLVAFGVAVALPMVASTVGDHSPGAFDNASGVVTVVGAALGLPASFPVGVVLTSAEELGLAGARAWAEGRTPGVAINCDGVGDEGDVTLMYTRRRPDGVIAAFVAAAEDMQDSARARRLVPGILTDGVALADAGWEVVTVSRARLGTLLRVHRPSDGLRNLAGTTLAKTSALVARAAEVVGIL